MAANDNAESGKRPWVAVLLAMIYPGLGHLYLREWIRGIMWFGLIVSAVMLLLPESAYPETFSVEAYLSAAGSIPLQISLTIVALSVLSVLDAYWLARRENEPSVDSDGDTRKCPNCGKELDTDLDFCHWCTTRIGGVTDEDAA